MSNSKTIVMKCMENKLDEMRESINATLSSKAAKLLETKKIDIAKSYFGQKNV